MNQKNIAIVFDCGATNIRVIAMDTKGQILASRAMPNETDEDPYFSTGRIWDLEKLWYKFTIAAREVTAQIDTSRIAGVTVTTFGVDGAFVDTKGALLYPVVSWQCERTHAIMENIGKYIPIEKLYEWSGVFPYVFNTINKMIWFKENRADIIENAHRFIFISSLLIHKLCASLQNDTTMAGTSMMTHLKKRTFSSEILGSIGIKPELFGNLAEPGNKAGEVHKKASDETDLPIKTPVFFAGHDTQFAIFGSGADLHQPILSSGTWEILMVRSNRFKASSITLSQCLTAEQDSVPGVLNIGQNWLGSGVLEWFSKKYYGAYSGDELYETMISEAEQVVPGANNLRINPALFSDGFNLNEDNITGKTDKTTRGELYRALLEHLALRLKEGLEALQISGDFNAKHIICVGGGSKNRLWNQLRADTCEVPIHVIDQKETTVLGASLFVFAGAGIFTSAEEARKQINYKPKIVYPSGKKLLF